MRLIGEVSCQSRKIEKEKEKKKKKKRERERETRKRCKTLLCPAKWHSPRPDPSDFIFPPRRFSSSHLPGIKSFFSQSLSLEASTTLTLPPPTHDR
jgi:hypothetical protein